MKYITLVMDGSADRPNAALSGKTPLEYASTPNLDALAKRAAVGRVQTIPDGLEVGSAVANMSLLGFDPHEYRGRAVIEAAGAGLPISKDNLYIRANFVEFSGEDYDRAVIANYSAHDIPTAQSEPLTELLSQRVFAPPYVIHNVGTFRNILEVEGGASLYPLDFAPAHDIIGKSTAQFQTGEKERPFYELQRRAYEALAGNGSKANGVWFWGASVAPNFPKAGAGRCTLAETVLMCGLTAVLELPNTVTDDSLPFDGFLESKLENSLAAIEKYDDVYIHIQATDDLSHDLAPLKKMAAIEKIDGMIGRLLSALKDDYALLVVSDHYTFSDTGAHGAEPAPFMLVRSGVAAAGAPRFTEQASRDSGVTLRAPELLRFKTDGSFLR